MIHILKKIIKTFPFLFVVIFINYQTSAKDRLIIGTSTSTYDSGLMSYLEDSFEKEFNYNLDVISKGTGQILEIAKIGLIDILIVHHEKSEKEFMINGYGKKRYKIMYNDYVIVGPKDDQAKISEAKNLEDALKNIYNSDSLFISRSDNSGTHFKEMELWKFAKIDTLLFGPKYKKIGSGMGATLNLTNNIRAYTITDRSTWATFKNKENLKILFEGSTKLFNQYSLILVNQKKGLLKNSMQEIFVKWILSKNGEKLINNYKINNLQLFYFNGEHYIN